MIKLHYTTPAGQSLSLANTLMQPLRGILAKDSGNKPKTQTLGPNPHPKSLNAQRSQSPQDPIVHWGYTGIMEKKLETTTVYWGYI